MKISVALKINWEFITKFFFRFLIRLTPCLIKHTLTTDFGAIITKAQNHSPDSLR